jgi:hypothetical protein
MEQVINKKNKVKGILARAAAFGMAASSVATMTAAQVFADDFGSVTVSGDDVSASTVMGKVIGMLLTITRFAGVALAVYGVYEIIMSFTQNQAEAKTKGVIMTLSGVIMVALKSVLIGFGIITG